MELMNFDFTRIKIRKPILSQSELLKLFATNPEPTKKAKEPDAKATVKKPVKPRKILIKRGLR